MNFFQRALKNVTRRKTKTILLLLTFFVIGNFVIVGLGISQAAQSAKILTRKKMRAVVTYQVDYNAVNKYVSELTDEDEINNFYTKNYPSVKLSDVAELLKDERVKTANVLSTQVIYAADGFDYVHLNNKQEQNSSGQSCYIDENGNETCQTYLEPAFFLKANAFPDMIEFADNMYNIVSGNFYTQDDIDKANNVVLITQALADVNGLKIGDTISFYIDDPTNYQEGGYMADTGITSDDLLLECTIIGIYDHNSPVNPNSSNYEYMSPYENPDNMILMPSKSYYVKQIERQIKMFDYYAKQYPDDESYKPENRPSIDDYERYANTSDATFLLNDPLNVDTFVSDYSNNLPQFMTLNADNEEFVRLSKPLDTLSLYASIIVWMVVINAVIIITLVTALTLKNREYEIGVLLSIGASKFKVVSQFFLELAITAVLGFTLAIISGSLIANRIGQTVLQYQIVSSGVNEDEDNNYYNYNSIWDNNYTTEINLDDIVAEYKVNISPLIIAEIYILGLGIVLVSTIIPSLMIMRYNPKQILMNQN